LHQLASSFILGYHGCDKAVGEGILKGEPFKQSNNDYDWLGPGIYFWEANPIRGLDFAREAKKRRTAKISNRSSLARSYPLACVWISLPPPVWNKCAPLTTLSRNLLRPAM
jgi:hypothetical protein